ncbi:hypothetical protein NU219Hw_g292t1 [Hortaea werneckii]
MSPPRLSRLGRPAEKSALPPTPKPAVDVLASLLQDLSTIDRGKTNAAKREAPSQHEATRAPALPESYGKKQKSEQEGNKPYAPTLLMVQPSVSATPLVLDTKQRDRKTSTTPTQTQVTGASSQHTKADGSEKQNDPAVSAATTAPPTQTRKRGIDALH